MFLPVVFNPRETDENHPCEIACSTGKVKGLSPLIAQGRANTHDHVGMLILNLGDDNSITHEFELTFQAGNYFLNNESQMRFLNVCDSIKNDHLR
jgi:hypothetical protein